MLNPKKIEALRNKPWLSPEELADIFITLDALIVANENQAGLLTQALEQLDSLTARLSFYRSVTTRLL